MKTETMMNPKQHWRLDFTNLPPAQVYCLVEGLTEVGITCVNAVPAQGMIDEGMLVIEADEEQAKEAQIIVYDFNGGERCDLSINEV